jgi:hypothetical protein
MDGEVIEWEMTSHKLDAIMVGDTEAKIQNDKHLMAIENVLHDMRVYTDTIKRPNTELLQAQCMSREETTLLRAAIETLMWQLDENAATPTPPSPAIMASSSSTMEEMSLQWCGVQKDIQDVLDVVRNPVGKRKHALSSEYAKTELPSPTTRRQLPQKCTSVSELTQHLDTIQQAAQSVHTSLEPPYLNEKCYKLAVHGILTDHYANTEDRMHLLKEEIERSNERITLAQRPRYMFHLDKCINKAASSVVITVRTPEELPALKRNKVTVIFEPRRVTEFHSACKTDQCHRCQLLGHHHATCKLDTGPTCGFCTENHPTDQHRCPHYPHHHGKMCPYINYKCSNCVGAGSPTTDHTAFSTRCPHKNRVIQEAWEKTRPMATTTTTTDNDTNMTTHI